MPGQTTDSGRQDQSLQEPVQSPGPLVLPLGLQNPDVLQQGVSGDKPQIQRPGRLVQGQPPLGGIITIPQSSHTLPLGQSALQANINPFVVMPVLARVGPNGNAWALSVALGGLTVVTVRGTYRDIKITPGFRGIQLQYTSVSTSVTVRENTTGMLYFFGAGPKTVLAPLFMLREVFDLTITSGGAAFAAGATALLTTEEQMPYQYV